MKTEDYTQIYIKISELMNALRREINNEFDDLSVDVLTSFCLMNVFEHHLHVKWPEDNEMSLKNITEDAYKYILKDTEHWRK